MLQMGNKSLDGTRLKASSFGSW